MNDPFVSSSLLSIEISIQRTAWIFDSLLDRLSNLSPPPLAVHRIIRERTCVCNVGDNPPPLLLNWIPTPRHRLISPRSSVKRVAFVREILTRVLHSSTITRRTNVRSLESSHSQRLFDAISRESLLMESVDQTKFRVFRYTSFALYFRTRNYFVYFPFAGKPC